MESYQKQERNSRCSVQLGMSITSRKKGKKRLMKNQKNLIRKLWF